MTEGRYVWIENRTIGLVRKADGSGYEAVEMPSGRLVESGEENGEMEDDDA